MQSYSNGIAFTMICFSIQLHILSSIYVAVGREFDFMETRSIGELSAMNQLIQAVQREDAKEFARILSHHPNPSAALNQRDSDGWTVTHHAAYGNNPDIVSIVMEKGGDPLSEIPRIRNTPLHLALTSEKEKSESIAVMLHKKAFELKVSPRPNKEGNHPLHLAAKNGYESLVKALLLHYPEAKNITNTNGMTPLGAALSSGHKEIADSLVEVTEGSPLQFEDFETIFSSFNAKAQRSLAPPVKIFVVGDNSCGKSTLIKSIQGESFYDRIWGIAYNTTNVPTNKVGLVPNDFQSRNFGRVIFYDLASGANFIHENLLDSADDLAHSVFIIVVDSRPEKKVMEQRLEFWLSFILMQCSKFPSEEPIYNGVSQRQQQPQVRPNVLIVASYGELHSRAFRNAPAVRLQLVVRAVTRHNREITRRTNIINSIALDCRKSESPPMRQVRDELNKLCRRRLRPQAPQQLHCRCFILSDILRQLELETEDKDDRLPILKLGDLASLVQQKSSETEPNLYHLLPQDSGKLLWLCKALEEVGRLILIPSSRGEEKIWIAYGKKAIADKLDKLFVNHLNRQAKSAGSTALMTYEALEECLQPVASVGMDVLTKLLEHFKVHDNSVREISKLPSEPPYFFFPTLLSESLEKENWETEDDSICFGWSIIPSKHQVSRYFLPRFTKSLLLLLFQRCGDARDFEHRCLWSEGIHFQDKISAEHRQLEVTIIVNSKAIILNMRFHSNIEIPVLHLRNLILSEIHSHRENIQPQTLVEENLIPSNNNTVTFPVRSQTMPRKQYSIAELKKTISKSSLSLVFSPPPSGTSTPSGGTSTSRISGSSESLEFPDALPFFEPCLFLPKLSLPHRLCLLRPDYSNSELTDSFLRDFRHSIGPHHYKAIVDFFNLPIITATPPSSVHSSQVSVVPISPPHSFVFPTEFDPVQPSSIDSTCSTFGKLVDCLDSISICNTTEVLTEAQVCTN